MSSARRSAPYLVFVLILSMAALGGVIGVSADARPATGSITGRVTDLASGNPLPAASIQLDTVMNAAASDSNGRFTLSNVSPGSHLLTVDRSGYHTAWMSVMVSADSVSTIEISLEVLPAESARVATQSPSSEESHGEVNFNTQSNQRSSVALSAPKQSGSNVYQNSPPLYSQMPDVITGDAAPCYRTIDPICPLRYGTSIGTEEYAPLPENRFQDVFKSPLSTFSVDVDVASYGNARRFLQQESLPPEDAVRIEEFINYFDYNYPEPGAQHPFSVTVMQSDCPWEANHRLIHIGLQGRRLSSLCQPSSNLVFLIDVSGSMQPENKLPLVRKAFHMLVDQLHATDRVAIVVYAGAAGLVLPSTAGVQSSVIHDAIDRLQAGGSTAGEAGIKLAYQVAQEHLIKNGNNRIILATDGDFNVGTSNTDELVRLIEEKRKAGVFLTVLGFGMGNLKDARLEKLADKGNGNYAYIDNLREAHKVFVTELTSTLFTIAKDVKLQVEFNPACVSSYRLIGYENRMLARQDFANDAIDAGEIGSGHTVTALYEITPARGWGKEDPLRYQTQVEQPEPLYSDEVLTVKLRYKDPGGEISKLMEVPVKDLPVPLAQSSDDFRFSAAVAEFGLLLRESNQREQANWDQVLQLAQGSLGNDREGFRSEFLDLVHTAKRLSSGRAER